MISATIRAERLEQLRQRLFSMNLGPGLVDPDNPLIPFGRLGTLHFARFLIIDPRNTDDITQHGVSPNPMRPTLFFMGDCDDSVERFLIDLTDLAREGLNEIFSHCEGFSCAGGTLLDWMRDRNVSPAANYVNWIGRTVTQVKEEAALHRALTDHLNTFSDQAQNLSNEELRQHLREHVLEKVEHGALTLTNSGSPPWSWRVGNQLHRFGIPIGLLAISPLLLLLTPVLALRLRYLERKDPEITPPPETEHVSQLAAAEDHLVTNQFSAFGDVKPGAFRRALIVFFLFMLNYASRHVYNRGNLTRVRTIHFARWVLINNKQQVLFASNYDGDLESYMDDFINKVGWGLNLVFSNGVGWPRTRWLIKGGAEYEQRFKYYLRRHQHETAVWYKAYPDLTAVELERNSIIREGLFKPKFRSKKDLQRWLDLI